MSGDANGMVDYHVTDGSGKVLRSGRCPRSMVEIQAVAPGEVAVEGTANPEMPDHRAMLLAEQARIDSLGE